jgi:hypothetical protein
LRHLASLTAFVFLFFPRAGTAQAWLPPPGEISLDLLYQNYYVRDHLSGESQAQQLGTVRTNAIVFGLTYGITDRFAASATLPYVYSHYNGPLPHDPHVDNGDYHGEFADYRIDLRYNLLRNPALVTPFAAAIIPSHHYVTFAHSAPSVDLHEYLVGLNFGRRLDPIVPAGFVQGRYSYAFVDRKLGISHNRSNYDLELGYFVTPSLTLSAIGNYQRTHGGIDFPLVGTPAFVAIKNSPLWPYHDVIARAEYLNVGGAVSYALTGSVDVTASYVSMVWGKNIHKLNSGVIVGFGYNFSPEQTLRRFFPKDPPKIPAVIE